MEKVATKMAPPSWPAIPQVTIILGVRALMAALRTRPPAWTSASAIQPVSVLTRPDQCGTDEQLPINTRVARAVALRAVAAAEDRCMS
jgi:hypothetical protein